MPTNKRNRTGAFTLVELLIVVAIIAILAALILPMLSTAREQARRAACSGSQRAIATAMISYAADNKDRIPLCYWGDWDSRPNRVRRMGYFISYSQVKDAQGEPVPDGHLGLLIMPEQEYLANERDFYCPSSKDPTWQYNTTDNPWWDDPNRDAATGNKWTRLGYTTRPVVRWKPDDKPANESSNVARLPKMGNFKSSDAMLCDVIDGPESAQYCHKDGINVTRMDGSVNWFDFDEFPDSWHNFENLSNKDDFIYEVESQSGNVVNLADDCAWELMSK